jgi:hypothetical protein
VLDDNIVHDLGARADMRLNSRRRLRVRGARWPALRDFLALLHCVLPGFAVFIRADGTASQRQEMILPDIVSKEWLHREKARVVQIVGRRRYEELLAAFTEEAVVWDRFL